MSSPPCVTATPDKYGHVPFDACNSYYTFNPSFVANMVFAVLFGLSTVTHVIQAAVFKKTFCWVLIMGGIWETAAFSLRTVGAHNQQELQLAIWGQLLFLLAPLWINAFAYMTVARMVHFGLPEKKIWGIRAVRLTVLFVWLDIVCFLVQAAGGSMLSNNDDANITQIGMKIYTAGIGVQLAFVVIFGFMTAWFYRQAHEAADGKLGRLRFLIWAMIAVLLLIVMRVVFRLVEFGPGVNSSNEMITKEVYPLALDAMPMVLALALLNIVHPGVVLRGPDGEFPKKSRAEKKAIKQAKKDAKQTLREQKLATKNAAKEEKKAKKQAKQGKVSESFVMMELGSRSDNSDYGHGTR